MKRKKSVDLKSLWERAAKRGKEGPQPISVDCQAQNQIHSVPIEVQVQPHDDNVIQSTEPEPEVETAENDTISNEPEIEMPSTEPLSFSPVRECDETENDESSDDESIYDVDLLSHDPGKRTPIRYYDVNERNPVIRGYIALGSCQPRSHDFPIRQIGGKPRRFISTWFDEYRWLEYSVELDAAFCYVCYLFKHKTNCSGGDAFVNQGFRNWNMKKRISKHVGGVTSLHNMAQEKYNAFLTPKATIVENFSCTTNQDKVLYLSRLSYSLQCLKFILRQGLACRGHNEREDSLNRGNFLELLNWLAENFEEVNKVVLKNAPRNCKLTAPEIQKDIIKSCAQETTKLIMEDLGDDYFAILADESSDVYQREQLALCLRYVDKKGRVVERFLGVVHVENTTASTLKAAIVSLLMDHSLSLSMVRGQGYDGASNMKGHINGLKKLIMDDSPSAHYVHCFAHQLQLTLVAVSKENPDCIWFFDQLRFLLTIIGNSCKKTHMLRVAQAQRIVQALELGEIETGKGLNQEMGLGRPGDTRWGSHYKTVFHVVSLYPSIRQVLIKVGNDRSQGTECTQAQSMLTIFKSYEFVFMAHLLLTTFGYTDDLNHALQKRDQDIVNAIDLIYLTKHQLQFLREDNGWEDFLKDVNSFCVKYDINIADMDGPYKPVGRDRRFFPKARNKHRFHVDMFLSIIDRQLRELNDRFDEVNTDLLLCMASFNPVDSFAAYDKDNLVKLAQFYPKDFSSMEMHHLPTQLGLFIADMRRDERFRTVKNIADLSVTLVKTNKHTKHDVVYKLLKLVLILPVATASVERVFSSMNFVKTKLRNRMGDNYLNNCLVTFIEREFFLKVKDDDIIKCFQDMKERKIKL